jgi:flagellar protein FlaG
MHIQTLGAASVAKPDERPAVAAAAQPVSNDGTAVKPASSAAAPSRGDVDTAVKTLNDSMKASSQSLEFSVDEESKEIVVKLIDQSTKEVVRQIPSVEALQMAKSIDKMQGRLINQTA